MSERSIYDMNYEGQAQNLPQINDLINSSNHANTYLSHHPFSQSPFADNGDTRK